MNEKKIALKINRDCKVFSVDVDIVIFFQGLETTLKMSENGQK